MERIETFDASGTFEADEVIVSSELPGKILTFNVEEGNALSKDTMVGVVDAENIDLQKQQVEASIKAFDEKTSDVTPQVKVIAKPIGCAAITSLDNLLHEQARIENLVKAGCCNRINNSMTSILK